MLQVKRQRLSIQRISSSNEQSAINHAHDTDTEVAESETLDQEEEKTDTMEVEIEQRVSSEHSKPKFVQRRSISCIPAPVHFLRSCGSCQCRLGPGLDTFIYRGEFAFCSRECRQRMIAKEEHQHKFERWLQKLIRSYSPLAIQTPGFENDLHF